MKTTAAALLLAAGFAGSAAAQCSIYRNGMPDFDQKRDALPNDGGMYCVPTSAINLMAYIANHGVPNVLNGPRNWQSNANYNYVTGRINAMGGLMDTDPFDGTSGNGNLVGSWTWLMALAPFKFTVTHYYGDYNVSSIYWHTIMNRLVNVCYGYYAVDSLGRYGRNGGHCVTLTGLIDVCDPFYTLRWRDPANDNALLTQSTFTSKLSDASSQTFIATDNLPRNRIRLWDLGVDSTTRRYLDSYLVIKPLVCLSGGISTSPGSWHVHFPVQIAAMEMPSHDTTVPDPDAVIQVALDFQDINAYIVTSQIIPRQQKVWCRNLATGEYREILSSSSSLKIATDRFGKLFVAGDGSVRKYGFGPAGQVMLEDQAATPHTFTALTYDDRLDELVGVTANDRLVRLANDLDSGFDEPLPTGVAADGSVSIAVDPTIQKYLICGSNAPTIWAMELIPGSPRLRIQSSWLLPAVQHPTSLMMSDDRSVIAINDGTISEFEQVIGAAGNIWRLKAGSPYNGLPGERTLAIGRSRSNAVVGEHDTREWRNVLVTENVPEVIECDADFNEDGVLDSSDFFAFLDAFFDRSILADWTHDGFIDSSDFFDYLGVFLRGC